MSNIITEANAGRGQPRCSGFDMGTDKVVLDSDPRQEEIGISRFIIATITLS